MPTSRRKIWMCVENDTKKIQTYMRIIYLAVFSRRMLFHLYAGVVITIDVAVMAAFKRYDFHKVTIIFNTSLNLFVALREIQYY